MRSLEVAARMRKEPRDEYEEAVAVAVVSILEHSDVLLDQIDF